MISVVLFWGAAALVAYAYVGYPLLAAWLSAKRGREPARDDACPPITVLLAAYNEEERIHARLRDVLRQDYPADHLQVLVVSDGSEDRTVQFATLDDPRVTVLALSHNIGKSAALDAGMAQVRTPIVVFADARQRFADGALRALVAAFADPRIGAVSGELMLDARKGGAHDIGLYWRMEKRLRSDEARLGWLHGATGAIHAVRRELFQSIPPGTVLDDVWIPMHVRMAGYRVWMSRDAIAIDHGSNAAGEEFARKLRTLAGNWQLLWRLPVLAHPLRNPVFFAWFSHKFLRLLVPWALLAMLLATAILHGPWAQAAFAAQLFAYAWASAGLWWPWLARRVPLLPAASTFLLLNLAALLSLPAAVAWAPSRLWKKH